MLYPKKILSKIIAEYHSFLKLLRKFLPLVLSEESRTIEPIIARSSKVERKRKNKN